MSSNIGSNNGLPIKDPYKVLGLSFGATDTEIAKAYRTLARTLHPDKLVSQKLSTSELDRAVLRFHDIQTARSFLLDVEHVESRRKYDTKLASEQIRRVTDEARERGMSEKRKRMRDELQQYEAQEASLRSKIHHHHHHHHATASTKSSRKDVGEIKKSKLAQEGLRMREKYAVQEEFIRKQERDQAIQDLQNRQIKLKWSRKKLQSEHISSPSEDTIVQMLSSVLVQHGAQPPVVVVEQVQMLGHKGNAALVTLTKGSYCDVIVQLYRTSDLWRAVYVNKKKQEEVERGSGRNNNNDNTVTTTNNNVSISKQRDTENVHDWKERQAQEREALLRQMETADDIVLSKQQNVTTSSISTLRFPIPFPNDTDVGDNNRCINPLELLEHYEDKLLMGIVSNVMLQQMKVIR